MQAAHVRDRLSPLGREIVVSLRRSPRRLSALHKIVGQRRIKESTIVNLSDLYEVVETIGDGIDPLYQLTERGERVAAILESENVDSTP